MNWKKQEVNNITFPNVFESNNYYYIVDVVDEQQTVLSLQRQVKDLLYEKNSTQRFLDSKREAHLKMKNNFMNEISRK